MKRLGWLCLTIPWLGCATAAPEVTPEAPAVSSAGGAIVPAGGEMAEEGRGAPSFRLPLYNPRPGAPASLGLDRYVGTDPVEKDVKVVLLSFMASYCAPCKKELPYLQRLHERYEDRGLRVMSVAIDTEPQGQRQVSEMIAASKVTFPVLKDRFNLVARRWLGNEAKLPSVFLIRPDGTISTVHRGYDKAMDVLIAGQVEAALGVARPAE